MFTVKELQKFAREGGGGKKRKINDSNGLYV